MQRILLPKREDDEMIYLVYIITMIMTAWLNAKFINDSSGINQYWHEAQLLQQLWIYISYLIIVFFYRKAVPLILFLRMIAWAFCYIFLYNSTLNLFRALPIDHLGKYDLISFGFSIALLSIGILIGILAEIFFNGSDSKN